MVGCGHALRCDQGRATPGGPHGGLSAILVLVATVWLLGADDAMQERRERIARMAPHEQAVLRENLRRFRQLDADAQKQLWRIHRELAESPDAPRLREVMRRYGQWLTELPMTTQCELTELPSEGRIAQIQMRIDEEHDSRVLKAWLRKYLPRLLRALPQPDREQMQGNREQWRRPEAMPNLFSVLGSTKERREALEKALEELHRRLSPSRAAELARQTPKEQCAWIQRWAMTQQRERFWQQLLDRALDSAPPKVSDQQLAKFFEGLKPEMQDQILGLPSEEMYEKLREMFYARQRLDRPRPRGPRGPHNMRPGFGPGLRMDRPPDPPPGPPPDSPPPRL